MPTRSIETIVETYGMQLLRTHPALKGIAMRHKDDRQKPQPTCITFSATKGADKIGLNTSEVELTVSYRAEDKRTPQQNSMIIDAIDECFSAVYVQRGMTVVEDEMQGVWMMDEKKDSNRPDTQNFRKFTLTIPFLAGKA